MPKNNRKSYRGDAVCLTRVVLMLGVLLAGSAPSATVAGAFATSPASRAIGLSGLVTGPIHRERLSASGTVTGTAKIVFVNPLPTGTGFVNSNIWSMDLDGANAVQLTSFNGEDSQPALSPDGTRISYISRRDHRGTLRVMDSDGTDDAELPLAGFNGDPAWSPDGDYLAYSSSAEFVQEIWVAEADGGQPHRVSYVIVNGASQPTWSPDGLRLAFAVDIGTGNFDVYTVTAAGGEQTQITFSLLNSFSYRQPAWSPDGSEIATIRGPGGGGGPYDLWLMKADGTEGRVLVKGIDSADESELSWSGDGNWLMFGRNGQAWRVSRSGTIVHGISSRAAWQPDTNAAALPDLQLQYLPQVHKNACVTPLYFDGFSDPSTGWPNEDFGDVLYQYTNSEYQVLLRNADWIAGAAPGYKTSDALISTDVRAANGSFGSFGLLFGLSDNWGQFYLFEIDTNGFFALWRFSSESGWTLLTGGGSGAIHTGTDVNTLAVHREGAQITVYANGSALASLSDGTYTSQRRVGVMVTSYDDSNVDIRFDDYMVQHPFCPTPTTVVAAADHPGWVAAQAVGGAPQSPPSLPAKPPLRDALAALERQP